MEPTSPEGVGEPGCVRAVVIDDNEDMRTHIGLVLRFNAGVTVVGEAGDGLEGVDVARRCQPDVIILDLLMPRLDGYGALPLLLQAAPNAKVIVLSAAIAPGSEATIRARGAHLCLLKSTDPDDFAAAVRNLARPGVPPVELPAAACS